MRAAYAIARTFRSGVLAERYIRGHDYRLLVINGELVAVARRGPAQLVGDGQRPGRAARVVEERLAATCVPPKGDFWGLRRPKNFHQVLLPIKSIDGRT